MPLKKSKKRSTALEETSLFSSAMVDIIVDSATLHVHRALVESTPKLLARFQEDIFGPGCPTADLKSVSLDVGHVLVQWLYSRTYQLRQQETPPSPCQALKTAFGVYSLARVYDLSGLETLAREQIALLGSANGVFTFIDVIADAHPRTVGKDAWLQEYVTTRMQTALKNGENLVTAPEGTLEAEENVLVAKFLVKGVLDAYRAMAEDLFKAKVSFSKEKTFGKEAQARITQETRKKFGTAVSDPSRGSQYELAREAFPESALEVVPEVESEAVEATTTEIAAAENGFGSPDNGDWFIPSPQVSEHPAIPCEIAGAVAKEVVKKGTGRNEESLRVEEPVPEAEPLPEPAPVSEPEAVPEIAKDDECATSLKKRKKGKKSKEAKAKEPEPEPAPEPEPEGVPEPAHYDEWAASLKESKKNKTKKASKVATGIWADLIEEPAAMPESFEVVMVEADAQPKSPWDFWGAKKSPRPSLS